MSVNHDPSTAKRVGLFLGPLACVTLLLLPPAEGLSLVGWRTLAVAVLMAVFWMTEAIPIPATALLPLALFPVLGISDMSWAAAPYAHELVYLQLGGFALAVAMERWGLHRRIALFVVAKVGTSPQRLVLGVMLATAFLSMWISNSATTAMMLPIAVAISLLFKDQDQEGPFDLGICLVLGLAYAATMGGVATLIGTPPNVVLAAAATELLQIEIGFFEWMAVGLPLTCVMLPVGWFLLTRYLHPPGELRGDAAQVVADKRAEPVSVFFNARDELRRRCRVAGLAFRWMVEEVATMFPDVMFHRHCNMAQAQSQHAGSMILPRVLAVTQQLVSTVNRPTSYESRKRRMLTSWETS